MTLSRKMRRGPERKFLLAFTFRMQSEGWVDKVQGRFFFFLKQRKKKIVEVTENNARMQILQKN